MTPFLKSWKTTTLGCLVFAQALLTAVIHAMDGNPATSPDWQVLVTAFLAMAALFFSKDADRTGSK